MISWNLTSVCSQQNNSTFVTFAQPQTFLFDFGLIFQKDTTTTVFNSRKNKVKQNDKGNDNGWIANFDYNFYELCENFSCLKNKLTLQ